MPINQRRWWLDRKLEEIKKQNAKDGETPSEDRNFDSEGDIIKNKNEIKFDDY